MKDAILGISAYYHDSAAVLLVDGEIIAAAQEERFTRKKHDAAFPTNAAKYVLKEGGIELAALTAIAFYDKPQLKFQRLLATYMGFAPQGIRSFLTSIPLWVREKFFMHSMLDRELAELGENAPDILFPEHHLSHAASAFYPSPFEEAAILTVDGVGEWATTTICKGAGKDITILKELHFPHSLGLLYSAFTAFCGFRVNSGEYKLMGLAPYGNATAPRVEQWKQAIYDKMIDVRDDGSMLLNMEYFNYATGMTMCTTPKWEALFGIPTRQAESEISQPYMDLALAIQQVTEEIVFTLAETARELTGCENLVMAGGVALNCVANGKLLKRGTFKDVWIQPAAGDAGGALGAALAARHISQGKERTPQPTDSMRGAYLGPQFSTNDTERVARKYNAPFKQYDDFPTLASNVADLLTKGNAIGWFQGRMEYGPRALGNRSILGDPRHPEMQKKLNLKIKYREGFRPFAPSVMEEELGTWFDLDRPSPYMLMVAPVAEKHCVPLPDGYDDMEMYERLYVQRSTIPAVTHVDHSARIQSVSKTTNPRYWALIDAFNKQHGCGLVVNTSFNVRGEPIVCTPHDAYACFMRTEMDYLVIGDILFTKTKQPPWQEDGDWRDQFELD
ncbi:MAG: carbamoyltransferase [Pseudodesulfovibrio sp.]